VTSATRVAMAVVSILLAVGIAQLSQWPMHADSADSFIRLSWRTEPVRVEACRTLTEEDLVGVPSHMRRTEECSGDFANYELTLRVGQRELWVDTISPSGLRRDRPVYVLHDERVPAGIHRIRVSFSALVPPDFESDDPVTLTWEEDMTLAPREIGLVTLDPTGTVLLRR